MNNKPDITKDDMMPEQGKPAVPDDMDQAQKGAAEDLLEEGSYQ